MVYILRGLRVAFALAARAQRSATCWLAWSPRPGPVSPQPGQTLVGDKNCYGAGFKAGLASAEITLLRPARKGEPPRAAAAQRFKPSRQIIESANDIFY